MLHRQMMPSRIFNANVRSFRGYGSSKKLTLIAQEIGHVLTCKLYTTGSTFELNNAQATTVQHGVPLLHLTPMDPGIPACRSSKMLIFVGRERMTMGQEMAVSSHPGYGLFLGFILPRTWETQSKSSKTVFKSSGQSVVS